MLMELLPTLADAAASADVATGEAAANSSLAKALPLSIAGAAAALGVGMVGSKAAEAVGRNPGAFGNILTISIIGMALAEAIAIYGLVAIFLL